MLALPRVLGYAGLIPQLACLGAVAWGGPEWRCVTVSRAARVVALPAALVPTRSKVAPLSASVAAAIT